MTSTKLVGTMPLTQEKRLDSNFANNNDHSYLHKKFKKMATSISVFPSNISITGEIRQKETNVAPSTCGISISNGSIAAAHPEIEKIKEDRQNVDKEIEKNVQTSLNEEYNRISNVNRIVQVSGQTSSTDEFSNKTENLENDFIREPYNGNVGGRYICPYCKLSCAKPSVLQKHIRAHTNERPYPCVPCGFAFKTKSNLYKHRRSRTHALRLQGADVSTTLHEEDLSGGSESDTSNPPATVSEAGSDSSILRLESYESNRFSPESSESMTDSAMPSVASLSLNSIDNSKLKALYKPKFRAAFYQDMDEKDKLKKSISPNADFLTEHISKIISDNEAIVDVIDTPLQKKYGKIKQIAESKQLMNEPDAKTDLSPLNLSKYNYEAEHNFRKRSHSESFSLNEHHKHPLNPEGSIIKDLLLKSKLNGLGPVTAELLEGSLFVCPLCQIIFRSADNLETHRMYYCKGNINNKVNVNQNELKVMRPENIFVRSNSINVRLPETPPSTFMKSNISNKSPPLRMKPENLVIMKQESNDIIAPLPSPGPLLGNTRLVDTRTSSEYNRQKENMKMKPVPSPKRRIESRSDAYSPRLVENVSPRSTDIYSHSKLRCIEGSSASIRSIEEMAQHMRHNTTSLQMFGGEVKIVDHSGTTTTLRIEPSKNQLSPILIHQSLSPSKLVNDPEASSVVVRSGLHSGGTIVHNPPTPKESIGTPQPQTPRISICSTASSNHPNIHDRSHFQFPPLSAITAFNPLTLPPLSPSASPSGPTTIMHGGKLIPHVPGIPGPNTPGLYVSHSNVVTKNMMHSDMPKSALIKSTREDVHNSTVSVNFQHHKGTKYETQQLRNTRSPNVRLTSSEQEKYVHNQEKVHSDTHQYLSPVPIIKIKNVDEPVIPKMSIQSISKQISRPEGAFKRTIEGLPRTPILKENIIYPVNKTKHKEKSTLLLKQVEIKSEKETRNFNFENLITKAEIYNNQVISSSEVQKNMNVQDTATSVQNERSETLYFQKSNSMKQSNEDRKPKFLRPSTLPLKPGTFTPKKHHGITPNANTMPLVSPETPRPAKAYGQLYLNGNAYTYLGLKCSTKVFYCTINRPQPTYVPNQHFLSMYSNWQLLSELTPDPLGLSASSAMSLYDSRHRPQSVAVAEMKQDLILTHSSQWNKISTDNKQMIQATDLKKLEETKSQTSDVTTPKKELAGGFESNEEYTYVRGRGRGRYVCSECGIRCKKPSMLKKHIRTHTDVRPYTCIHCAFSFKTKGNLTKHMKSKAHYKKCCELGINPNEGNDCDGGEMAQCSGETDDETESDGDEGNEGETESSDTEACKSRLPEHEAAHCLLSLGSSRPSTSATPGLITSARPTTYPYTPIGHENCVTEVPERLTLSRSVSMESRLDNDNEPMDLSKTDLKPSTPTMAEIPTARESSVLASLASNTAKLPQQHSQWSNGEPMLHTYLTERALQDTKIKQSQLTSVVSKLRKVELESSNFPENYKREEREETHKTVVSTSPVSVLSPQVETKVTISNENDLSVAKCESVPSSNTISNSETKRNNPQNSNTENAKHVVSEYLKQARINQIKNQQEDKVQNPIDNVDDVKKHIEENTKVEDNPESESMQLNSLEHEPVARKVVIGVGGVAFKVTKSKDFENTSYTPGRLMEDGRRVCDFCNKSFTKPSQLKLHLNIHYMERPFRCSVCAVSFRTRGHLQKHERSGSHHNKVSMTSTFGAATSFNPRPFRCSDCNIAFRIHGHLAKHLRSKMHVMRLECLFKLPFGTFTEIERAGVSLTDIDTTDCASSLASLQSLARKLHEKDPTKLEYREPSGSIGLGLSAGRDCSDDADDEGMSCENMCDSERDSEVNTGDDIHCQDSDTRVNCSATDN